MKEIKLQLFGPDMPPLYSKEDIVAAIDKVTEIDEQINELAIKREEYVKTLKEKIKKMDNI